VPQCRHFEVSGLFQPNELANDFPHLGQRKVANAMTPTRITAAHPKKKYSTGTVGNRSVNTAMPGK
jgi:hypothetical protein